VTILTGDKTGDSISDRAGWDWNRTSDMTGDRAWNRTGNRNGDRAGERTGANY
jgi:hypothetical protein